MSGAAVKGRVLTLHQINERYQVDIGRPRTGLRGISDEAKSS
jgi:hypothetical protein